MSVSDLQNLHSADQGSDLHIAQPDPGLISGSPAVRTKRCRAPLALLWPVQCSFVKNVDLTLYPHKTSIAGHPIPADTHFQERSAPRPSRAIQIWVLKMTLGNRPLRFDPPDLLGGQYMGMAGCQGDSCSVMDVPSSLPRWRFVFFFNVSPSRPLGSCES